MRRLSGTVGGRKEKMSTLHILINPDRETIVHTIHDDQLRDRKLEGYLKLHRENEGQPLARIIVRKGHPVKVIQAGEEEISR